MPKKHRIHPQGSQYIREAVPSPREVATFVAPRTMEDGLSIANIFGDAAEMTPFAGAVPYAERELGLRDYSDEDVLLSAIMGFPILGKVRTIKDAFTKGSYASWKSRLKHGGIKLYPSEEAALHRHRLFDANEVASSRGRVGATQELVEQPAVSSVMGPNRGGTNIGIRSEGQQLVNSNNVTTRDLGYRTTSRSPMNGELGYQGEDMYSPLRQKADVNLNGPFLSREKFKSSDAALNDNLAKLEDQWQFYVDDALGRRSTPQRAEEMANAAVSMGRPDIAEKIRTRQKTDRNKNNYAPYASYATKKYKNFNGDVVRQLDHANRQSEKLLREQFAMLPDNLKEEFTQRYGTWDLLQDWQQNPAKWNEYKLEVDRKRRHRQTAIKRDDRLYNRSIER